MKDIWNDKTIREVLDEGRQLDDIAVLSCPQCGVYSYYNQGSHFTCRKCNRTFYVCSEDEKAPCRPFVRLDGHMTLADLLVAESDDTAHEFGP